MIYIYIHNYIYIYIYTYNPCETIGDTVKHPHFGFLRLYPVMFDILYQNPGPLLFGRGGHHPTSPASCVELHTQHTQSMLAANLP